MNPKVEELVAMLRGGEGIGAAIAPTGSTTKFVTKLMNEAADRIETLDAALREARAVVAFEAEARGELDADYDQSARRALEQIDAALQSSPIKD